MAASFLASAFLSLFFLEFARMPDNHRAAIFV
jgi:hypothetical protein